jgi:hypothetical protein
VDLASPQSAPLAIAIPWGGEGAGKVNGLIPPLAAKCSNAMAFLRFSSFEDLRQGSLFSFCSLRLSDFTPKPYGDLGAAKSVPQPNYMD